MLVDDLTLFNNTLIGSVEKVLPKFSRIRVIACTRELLDNENDTLSINGKEVNYLTFFGFDKPRIV